MKYNMEIEYEATFLNINKEDIRNKLKKVNAKLIYPEFLQKRFVFNTPLNNSKNEWLRVRQENNKNTMSLKRVDGDEIENQKEICLEVDDFAKAVEFLDAINCKKKAYQENKRELWKLNNVEISIDEWPLLEPFLEIEGKSEEDVKNISKKLDLDYGEALFCAVGSLYKIKYGISLDVINQEISELTFNTKPDIFKKFLNN